MIIRHTYRCVSDRVRALRAYVRACVHQACCAAKTIRIQRIQAGVSFLLRKSCPTENAWCGTHGWKRLTCKLRARMLDTFGSSCESMHNRSDDTLAPDPLAFVASRSPTIVSNPRNGMRFFSPWMAGWLNIPM